MSINIEIPPSTVYSKPKFSKIWAETHNQYCLPLKQGLAAIYTKKTRFRLRKYLLADYGLYWGPRGSQEEHVAYWVNMLLRLLYQWRTHSIIWNLRHDQLSLIQEFENKIDQTGIKVARDNTYLIHFEGEEFDDFFSRSPMAVTRRQVRMAKEAGTEIVRLHSKAELIEHQELYKKWSLDKGVPQQPAEFVNRIVSEMKDECLLLGARHGGQLIAAAMFIQDKDEWFYFHGIRNTQLDKKFAIDLLIYEALKLGFKKGIKMVNLGGSGGIKSLEFFKSRWGGRSFPVWRIEVKSPTLIRINRWKKWRSAFI